ncbi:MAG: diguanylate cyclase [Gammaproteobacteria bacterium]|nr:diguanylate cyclase [Gammaproteobacteria bacterium]
MTSVSGHSRATQQQDQQSEAAKLHVIEQENKHGANTMDKPQNSNRIDKTMDTAASIESRVYREQVLLLFNQFQLAFIVAVLIAPIFVVFNWTDVNRGEIITWLIIFWIINLIRYFVCQHFLSFDQDNFDLKKWESYFLFGTAVSGALWGSIAFWFFPVDTIKQAFIFFILAGILGGSIVTLSSRPLAFKLFLLPASIPYIAKLIMLGTNTHYLMAGLLFLYVIMMFPISAKINSTITNSLHARFEKDDIVKKYELLQEHNDKSAEELQAELSFRTKREHKLLENEAFLESVLVTASDGIITADINGEILLVNHAIERDFGYSQQELIGQSINLIMTEGMGNKHDAYIKDYMEANGPSMVGRMIEVEGKRKDGTVFPIEITVSEARINQNIIFTGIIRDITERKATESKLKDTMQELEFAKKALELANNQLQNANTELLDQSQHDALTGLANRRYLSKVIQHEWFRNQRSKKSLSIILLDIDFFKEFNDDYGHQAGDDCLVKISRALEKQLSRTSDFIARYGGEEFIVLLPDTDQDGALHLAEKMRVAISNLKIEHKSSAAADHVTISGGVASTIPAPDGSCEKLISAADDALYQAKNTGRNSIKIAE